MRLSSTAIGASWLGNFDPEDQEVAKFLLDSLVLIGQDRLRESISGLISNIINVLPKTIALVPVYDIQNSASYHKKGRCGKPRLLLSESFPGSESIIANFATSAKRSGGPYGPIVGAPSLSNMRGAKCRSIIFLDDMSGSGERIVKFIHKFSSHPTIKSWRSLKLIRYYVVSYAVSDQARKYITSTKKFDKIHSEIPYPTFSNSGWSISQIAAVEALCLKYVNQNERSNALGYLKSRGLLVMSHSVPNNLPAILWQTRSERTKIWKPLFLSQAVPTGLLSSFSMKSELSVDEILSNLGQYRLSDGVWREKAPAILDKIIIILSAAALKLGSIERISEYTWMSILDVEKVVDLCRQWGLIGPPMRLTDAGLAELQHAKRLPSAEIIVLKGSEEPYYPKQLRVGR